MLDLRSLRLHIESEVMVEVQKHDLAGMALTPCAGLGEDLVQELGFQPVTRHEKPIADVAADTQIEIADSLIELGPSVLPYLLHDLEREPVHWFEALKAISGEDPVPREHWGNILAMQADWLAWGRKRGFI